MIEYHIPSFIGFVFGLTYTVAIVGRLIYGKPISMVQLMIMAASWGIFVWDLLILPEALK
jgi:hypothetical protein